MKKNTGRALLMSFLSLFLCVTMLLGTTFAWFTDEVTSTNNIIKSGTLDVNLEYKNSVVTDWEEVDAATNVFLENALWEPGHTEVVQLKVTNLGDLALKYNLGINIADEEKSVSINGTELKLSDHIMFGVYNGELNAERDAAIEAVKDTAKPLNEKVTEFGTIEDQNDSKVYTLVVYMPTTVGNEANAAVDAAKPTIKLGINLLATQLVAESDSFGPEYDEDADLLPPAWDGEGDDLPAEVDGVITINTAGELKAFADAVNGTSADTVSLMAAAGTSFSGKTVKLGADINLNNIAWTPIGACNGPAYFQGTFDGQGHTIYGLNVDNSADGYKNSTSGLFGWIDAAAATIKNVNISGATVKGSHWVGGVVGYMTGTIENCHVTNSTIAGYNVNDDANGDKVGGIVGCLNSKSSVIENTVTNTTIIGNRDIGGIAGSIAADGTAKNNKAANLVIIYVTEKSYASAGEIVSGRTGFVADNSNTASEVIIKKGSAPADGVIETAAKTYEITSKEGLLNVCDIIASSTTGEGQGIKVKLLCDIDLAGVEWKPIDKMWIDFDGNGHTIKNLKTEAWKAGFFGYLGGGSIKNLTLENVDITGSQVGAFAGAIEGTIDNCVLKGNNKITWVAKHQFDDPNAELEAWSGIGAITGITQPSTINATIAEGATVELNYGAMVTEASYVDELTGYIGTNKGTIVNNGEITVIRSATASTAAELQSVLNTALNGTVITLANDIEAEIDAVQKDNTKVIIDGNGNEFKGSITVDGGSAAIASAGIVIKNVVFDASATTYDACIRLGASGDTTTRYTNNVTVDNCTFIGDNTDTKVAIKSYTGGDKNLTVKNCVATDMHSLLQIANAANLTVEDCKVTGKRGFSVGASTNVKVSDTTINATTYGIRSEGRDNGGSLTVTDCNITANIPVVIRKVSKPYTVTFNGTNTMNETNTEGLWCIAATNEYGDVDKAGLTPVTAEVTVTLNDTSLDSNGVFVKK